MIRMKWPVRLGILGAAVSVAVLAISAATPSAAQGGAVVTGVHANEEFCKTMIRQFELFVEFARLDPISPDITKRAKYFADSKALNATLMKTAPASLASDVALAMKNSDAMMDAQLAGKAGDPARIKAATVALTSPEQLAKAKRMNDYCGVKITASK